VTAQVVDELDPATIRGLVARASDSKRERWLQQVRRTGACRHPVRLRGVVLRGNEPVYPTVDEPDGTLMVRCGNRREACCPSCAHEYRGDMWQLVYAGLADRKVCLHFAIATAFHLRVAAFHSVCDAPETRDPE
jgi:hypothetical protein